jgi:hypothetical protein
MRRPALLMSSGLALALAALPSCGGERIRLGDAAVATGGAGGDTGANAGASGDAGAGGNRACPAGQVLASEVLWIGDTWIQIPGTQHTRVRDLARATGAIGPNEDYANEAAPATDMAAIAQQYRTRESGATKVKVLLMDGGTWDPIAAQAKGEPVAPAIDNAVSTFQAFLAQVASDGTVEHIVYFLMPELSKNVGVATMRPLFQQACAASAVPCHFLDLQPLWLGHPEYTAPDGIQSSEAGARVIADSIWAIMQANCIAQAR